MKTCIYCGADNGEERTACYVCQNSLAHDGPGDDLLLPSECPPGASSIELNCVYENGFAYPDWRSVSGQVRKSFGREEWHAIYHEVSKQWLLELKEGLGGDYRCRESHNFLLLGAEGSVVSQTVLSYAEKSLDTIEANLGPLVNRKTYGKHVILAFSEPDDYYTYISHYHSDGDHSLSAGIFLSRGYMHIAFPFKFVYSTKGVLAHELVHNCIHHLNVPTWVHEGMAQRLEHVVLGRGFLLDREAVAEHYEYWNRENIQKFWAGTSFYGSDKGNQLSYQLSSILTEVLGGNWNDFLSFVQQCDPRDGGQDAALGVLGRCLGKTVEDFLGPGEWRPERKAIAAQWEKMKQPKVANEKEFATRCPGD